MKKTIKALIAIVMAATAVTGCENDTPTPTPTGTIDWANIIFVVDASHADEGDSSTRALKTGWATDDRIVAFFDDDVETWVALRFDGSVWQRDDASTDGPSSASGEVQALHAGHPSFGFNDNLFSDVSGDILYTEVGSYIMDEGKVYIRLLMQRGVTTAVKMLGTGDNMRWRLAGDGIMVNVDSDIPVGTPSPEDPEEIAFAPWLISNFAMSDITNPSKVAEPDPNLTTDPHSGKSMAVFHVIAPAGATNTTFRVYDINNPADVFTRTYPNPLPVGETVLLAGPGSDDTDEVAEWELPITSAELTVEAPKMGWSAQTAFYTSWMAPFSVGVVWSPAIGADGRFAADTEYTATITLTAKEGYTFIVGTPPTITLNGSPETVTPITDTAKKLSFDVAFPETGPVYWSLSPDDKTLSITGDVPNFGYNDTVPWHDAITTIETIVINDGVTYIGNSAFENCTSLTSVTIGDDVETLGHFVFRGCSSLSSVTIPASMTMILEHTFAQCPALQSVTCEGTTPPMILYQSFGVDNVIETLYVPANCKSVYEAADPLWKAFFTNILEPFTSITAAELTVTAPVGGGPVTTNTTDVHAVGTGFSVTSLSWLVGSAPPITVDWPTFDYGETYTAMIELTAVSGYGFDATTPANFTLNETPLTGDNISLNGNKTVLTIEYAFPETANPPADNITYPGGDDTDWTITNP